MGTPSWGSMPVVAVLGGSSPFTAGLADAIVGQRCSPAVLVLHGRSAENLAIVARYARARLEPTGWTVRTTTSIAAAVQGANVVVHQIRYGDLALRRDAEDMCAEAGVVGDETLGPAALLTALVAREGLLALAATVQEMAPGAVVINLTNPLSITTALLAANTRAACFGVCELPTTTANAVAACLNVTSGSLAWSYSGLNHRGFLHDLRVHGDDVVQNLIEHLPNAALPGLSADLVAALQAVPLKYFLQMRSPQRWRPGRSETVAQLRRQLLTELAALPDTPPQSLLARKAVWYDYAVVPVLKTLLDGSEGLHVVNTLESDGIVREKRACLSRSRCLFPRATRPPAPVAPLLQRFEEHERAFATALETTSLVTVREALTHDPTIAPGQVYPLAREILRRFAAVIPSDRPVPATPR